MNTDKAYILGLIIGGGVFGNYEGGFSIRLPYKKWGSYTENPQRTGDIARDILQKVGKMFRAIYNLSIQYEATQSGTWTILCEGDISFVKNDLAHYGITCEGELRGATDISQIVSELIDDNLKRRFIAGLADTIGSMAKSQRRFTDEHQIISFEIRGYNFKFVCDLCRLLYSINCIPDQVNWNHPNIHCTNDPYYGTWNKGFKLRILLDQFAQFGAFAFRTKADTSIAHRSLQKKQHVAERCETRGMKFSPSSVHPSENDTRLPEIIRGGHYIHFRHFCAVMGCEHAPYCEIKKQFKNLGKLINPFPILHKDEYAKIKTIIQHNELLSRRKYTTFNIGIKELLQSYENNEHDLIYGTSSRDGYPIQIVLQATAYVIANEHDLLGKRPKGKYLDVIKYHLNINPALSVEFRRPDLLTPLVIVGNSRGALVGACNPDVYRKLISFSHDNEYKILVRQITEEDLQNAN